MSKIIAPYGTWQSELSPQRLFRRPQPPAWPERYGGVLYWIEARAEEGGRLALMRASAQHAGECITPDGFNVRSRVHEYGGRCHALGNDRVYFSNYADQRLYSQSLDGSGAPRALPPLRDAGGDVAPVADPVLSPGGDLLVAVAEYDAGDGRIADRIVAWRLHPDGTAGEPVVLEAGRDFYANPCFSPDGGRLAWMTWNHPDMPWDASEAWVADLAAGGASLRDARRVAGGSAESVCQLAFAPDGTLVFARDAATADGSEAAEPGVDGWWNLYAWRDGSVERLTSEQAEFGAPHWQFGDARHVPLGGAAVVAVCTREGSDRLVRVEQGRVAGAAGGFNGFWHLHGGGDDGEVLAVAAAPDAEPCLVRIGIDRGLPVSVLLERDPVLEADAVSRAEALTWPTADGGLAHGWFYRPRNARYAARVEARPPLLVLVHGGPTSRATAWLDLTRQYWTTRGFAVLDVNHRGSTGYGRAYRQALNGRWGERDVADVADGIRFLASRDAIDSECVFIRGGSAGGYVVLRALTVHPQLFRGGACYYGIGDLGTLATITHRFEAGYIETLLGEPFEPRRANEPASVYHARSPVNHLDRLSCPMILFQGAEDRVTPPELSRDIAARLARKGIHHHYVEYPGEGHGFRQAETRIDSLERETSFYNECMRQ